MDMKNKDLKIHIIDCKNNKLKIKKIMENLRKELI
jgi:hypothetical protein